MKLYKIININNICYGNYPQCKAVLLQHHKSRQDKKASKGGDNDKSSN